MEILKAKVCPICKIEFIPNYRTVKFCSDECRNKGRKLVEQKKALKEKRERVRVRIEKTCEGCFKPFIAKKFNTKYCSRKCSDKCKPKIYNYICLFCGKEFDTDDKRRKFCSAVCIHNSQLKRQITTCKNCGKDYLPKDKRYDSFCSRECYFENLQEHKQKPIKITCEKCGYEFIRRQDELKKYNKFQCTNCTELKKIKKAQKSLIKVLYKVMRKKGKIEKEKNSFKKCFACEEPFKVKGKKNKFCSVKCQKKHHHKIRELKKRKKIKENGKIDIDISLEKLIKRDKNICHICKAKCVKKDFKITEEGYFITGNLYPTIDHVIAINNGGLHTWNNVKLAHFKCNSLKSDKKIYEDEKQQLTWTL